tara:strand:+ start:581 stop:841 length:261 start_codon:yes stop_codon:yes gene_type:complete
MSTLGGILFGLIFYWIVDLLSRQYFSFGGSRTLECMHWTGGGWTMSAAWKRLEAGPRAIPVPGTRPALLKLKGPRKNPGPKMRGRL